MQIIPNWRIPKTEYEGISLVLDIILFLENTKDDSVRQDALIKAAELAPKLSKQQRYSIHSIIGHYDDWLSLSVLKRIKQQFEQQVNRIREEHKANARSVILWHKHNLVYWHAVGHSTIIKSIDEPINIVIKNQSWFKSNKEELYNIGLVFLFSTIVIIFEIYFK